MERHGGCVLRFMVCGPDAVHVCAVAHNEVNQEEDLDAFVLVRATSAVWARGHRSVAAVISVRTAESNST